MFDWLRSRRAPPTTGSVTRDLTGNGWRIRMDLAPQVLSLSMAPDLDWPVGEEPLAPTCPDTDGFISASMLAVKAKVFDDGLYAAVELAAQPSKARLLAALPDVSPRIAAATRLAGLDTPLSRDAERVVETFLSDDASRPMGFYTWSEELRRIFQQDRLLQQPLGRHEADALRAALRAEPTLEAGYAAYLDLVARLTNPPVAEMPDLRQPGGSWFFPQSRSHEGDLVKRLYRDRPIPDGFSLADEMVTRLLGGQLHLDPTDASGWYDLQAWALEPLVLLDRMPEGARLAASPDYRQQLTELFKAILTLSRETHVKQLEIPVVASARLRRPRHRVSISPDLTVEPMRTYYERRAKGYEFARGTGIRPATEVDASPDGRWSSATIAGR